MYSINCSLLGQLLLLCVVIDDSIIYITEKKTTLPNICISQLLNQPLNKLKRASTLYLNITHAKRLISFLIEDNSVRLSK